MMLVVQKVVFLHGLKTSYCLGQLGVPSSLVVMFVCLFVSLFLCLFLCSFIHLFVFCNASDQLCANRILFIIGRCHHHFTELVKVHGS